jgi:uncharacterized membrane protein SirB2
MNQDLNYIKMNASAYLVNLKLLCLTLMLKVSSVFIFHFPPSQEIANWATTAAAAITIFIAILNKFFPNKKFFQRKSKRK